MSSRNGESARIREDAPASFDRSSLTKREREVVEWIVAGKRNDEIGKILKCSPRTVQKHVQHILEKLHLETRTGVCIWWYERRLNRESSAPKSRKLKRR